VSMWIASVSPMDQLLALVNMLMHSFFSCLRTKFLPYRQPALAGTRCDSCNARERHKRDTIPSGSHEAHSIVHKNSAAWSFYI